MEDTITTAPNPQDIGVVRGDYSGLYYATGALLKVHPDNTPNRDRAQVWTRQEFEDMGASWNSIRTFVVTKPFTVTTPDTVIVDLIRAASSLHDVEEYRLCAAVLEAAVPEALREDFFPAYNWDDELGDLRGMCGLGMTNDKFIRDYTDEPEAPAGPVSPYADVSLQDAAVERLSGTIQAALAGEDMSKRFYSGFGWSSSHQGPDYWSGRLGTSADTPLSLEDLQYMQGLLEYVKETSEPTEDYSRVSVTSVDAITGVLRGEYRRLIDAFEWNSTRQGDDYWNDRDEGDVPLSGDDRAYLQGLLEYAEARA